MVLGDTFFPNERYEILSEITTSLGFSFCLGGVLVFLDFACFRRVGFPFFVLNNGVKRRCERRGLKRRGKEEEERREEIG